MLSEILYWGEIALNAVIFVGILTLLLTAPFTMPILLRTFRLKRIASKFNLTHKTGIKFHIFQKSEVRNTNTINGVLNNKEVHINDSFSEGYVVPIRGRRGEQYRFGKRATFLTLDGDKYKLRGGLMGFASVSVVKQTLEEIKNNKQLTRISDYESTSFNILILFWVLLFIIAALIALSSSV